jgi:hypothetical protein
MKARDHVAALFKSTRQNEIDKVLDAQAHERARAALQHALPQVRAEHQRQKQANDMVDRLGQTLSGVFPFSNG